MEKGVNLIGFARAESGLGESLRRAAYSLEICNIPFCTINQYAIQTQNDHSWVHKEVEKPIYNINIFHMNPDHMMDENYHIKDFLKGRYNIGYWHWELPEMPPEWSNAFKYFDEIWVPSEFVYSAIAKRSPIPVIKVPHGVHLDVHPEIDRTYFNLNTDQFLFLTMYDTISTQSRKNPLATIQTFQKAFNKDNTNVGLILRVNSAHLKKSDMDTINSIIKDYRNIYVIDKQLNRKEINGLIKSVDCVVSLHRSEGWGMPLAEGMFLGKPVIGTAWSGNLEFMNEKNSYLVKYDLVRAKDYFNANQNGQYWAEPNIDHAAHLMKEVYDNRSSSTRTGINGQRDIKEKFSPSVSGSLMKQRLDVIDSVFDLLTKQCSEEINRELKSSYTIKEKLVTMLTKNNENFIRELFREFFGREVTDVELKTYHNLLRMRRNRLKVIVSIIRTREFIELINKSKVNIRISNTSIIYTFQSLFSLENKEFIRELYHQIFDRNPDSIGAENHLIALNSGVTKVFLLEMFLLSEEANSIFMIKKDR